MPRDEAGRAHLLPLFPGQRSRPPLRALPDDGRRVPHPPRLRVPARGPSRRVSVRLEEGTRAARVPDRLHLVRPGTPGSGPDTLADRLRQLLPALPRHLAPLPAGPPDRLARALGGLRRARRAGPGTQPLLLAPEARRAGAGRGPSAGRLRLRDRRDPRRPPRPPASRG